MSMEVAMCVSGDRGFLKAPTSNGTIHVPKSRDSAAFIQPRLRYHGIFHTRCILLAPSFRVLTYPMGLCNSLIRTASRRISALHPAAQTAYRFHPVCCFAPEPLPHPKGVPTDTARTGWVCYPAISPPPPALGRLQFARFVTRAAQSSGISKQCREPSAPGQLAPPAHRFACPCRLGLGSKWSSAGFAELAGCWRTSLSSGVATYLSGLHVVSSIRLAHDRAGSTEMAA
ncbi:hypothetical protein IQ07DRAFT_601368 [Pyrenochaeta sp. DS3sAY3a]|nr:hypothetical protein IQ07DRAFT_601368 [Pyrenochaeta sp. DS3sAY3a]